MRILALDLATTTGWAFAETLDRRPLRYGAETFFGDLGQFAYGFDEWLWLKTMELFPDMLAVEQPIIMHGKTTFATTCKLVGAFVSVHSQAYNLGLKLLCPTPTEWRKHFLGRGNAPKSIPPGERRKWLKDQTIRRCESAGLNPACDNAADAIGIWSYAAEQCAEANHG